ncbi:alpha-2-macroglobulin family protein [Niabella beijingensis]|uniref:alpha-2-macroglobulin family protein n=1 Tax=Niabella beijingensis TaxID=2872700 RepID=UPI001CBB4D52|nr:MG2 domain-containing protein [Niabella beijingensis]MBZ4187408.1 alpha-2-macroglobulin [Niabella beijingensis]
MKFLSSRTILLLIILVAFMKSNAQTIKNYEADWKTVEDHINKGLPASALATVKDIYAKATADHQEAQQVKALIYMNQLQDENRENNELTSITELEKTIKGNKGTVAALLNSYLAGVYQQYFNRNRYKLYDRTNTTGFEKSDPATWTIDDFTQKISSLYLESLKEEALLRQVRLENYDALIEKGNMRYLRPTLYDLLAFRALNYFKSSERSVTRPAYAFTISQDSAFAPAAVFAAARFETRDSLSLSFKALQLYQKLVAFHLQDARPDALIDADISRIQFVYQNAVHPGKEALYYKALQAIAEKYPSEPVAQQASFLMAQWHYSQAQLPVNSKNPENRDMMKARALLEPIAGRPEKSEGSANAYNLLQQIQQPEFSFQMEKVTLPDAPFRVLVSYRNVPVVYLRAIKATAALKAAVKDRSGKEKYWNQLAAATPVNEWQQALPAADDYKPHTAEIKADRLPAGEYYIVTSLNKNFSQEKNILTFQLVYVSGISYVNNKNDFFVLDRNSGQPLPAANVTIWQKEYDYKSSSYRNTEIGEAVTDRNGHFVFKTTTSAAKAKIRNNGNYLLDITYRDERFFMDEEYYGYYYYNDYQAESRKKTTSIFLFTDRSLYRPGQTVYFKGIAVNYDPSEKRSSVLAGLKTTATLYDANRQKVTDLDVTTNEFGSFNGSFRLPEGGLNGNFSISTPQGTASFKMEEYKRPTFLTDFEKMKGTYKLNEVIKVPGIAKAYAGNAVDGAKVSFRVVREARFPYPWIFSRYWWPVNQQQTEMTHGETVTDAEGRFTVTFTALPDLTIDPKMEPVFDYKIYADVTDINGEVRSGEKRISVGYKSLLIKAAIPERLTTEQLKTLHIRTENMAGEFEKADIRVAVTRLKPEPRLLRSRLWEQPDQFVMTKEAYISSFPNDIYKNEQEPASWPKDKEVLAQTGPTDSTGQFILTGAPEPGYYAVTIITKDKDGNEVKDIKYAEVYKADQKQPAFPQYLWTTGPGAIEPGEKTMIRIGSAAPDVFLVQGLTKEKTAYTYMPLNKEIKQFEFGATEADRGGYKVSYMFVKNNRFFSNDNNIPVPWSNKELKITYETFRDKTLPGAEEKWSMQFSGYKGDKVAAELLASMYDASLDQFYPHQWQLPSVWTTRYNYSNWNTGVNFTTVQALTKRTIPSDYRSFDKRYDWILGSGMADGWGGSIGGLATRDAALEEVVTVGYGAQKKNAVTQSASRLRGVAAAAPPEGVEPAPKGIIEVNDQATNQPAPQEAPAQGPETRIRKNFNETAFFFPDLKTDEKGNIRFSFTMPEALTRWKFQALAHTKELAFGYSSKEIVTQKELMVQPNMLRFLREGDKMEFSSKVVNLSSKEVTGIATLQLFDAATGEAVDGWFKNAIPQQYFTIAAGQSQAVAFPAEIPYQFSKPVNWRIIAKVTSNDAAALSDGEENALPVLTNRMLVTETLPLQLRGFGSKKFSFDKLLKSGGSETLTTQALTVEYTSNPAWYAVQALPYMMEYPYECAEQTWNRYYANSLATLIANSSPKIKQVFDSWKTQDTAALLGNLQKNQELKAVLLEETPWVLQAQSETQQKKNIALLFDLVRMSRELNTAYDKLSQLQSPNGGFVWFKGGRDDRYMTQYIVTGIGHLKKINAIEKTQTQKLDNIINRAIPYLDGKIKEEYEELIRSKTKLGEYVPSYYVIQYLYMRSFFSNIRVAPGAQKAMAYFTDRATRTWTQANKYMQGMTALALHRKGDAATPNAILKSLQETAINNEELGMYYKDAARSWWWYQAPIERQALIIEAFEEIAKDKKTADDLRTWLLKNKQTNNWESTKATAEACYALLLQGTQWLTITPEVTIDLGGLKVESALEKTSAGTGYFKKTIPGEKVRPAMGAVTVSVAAPAGTPATGNTLPTWGSLYWQYFEDLDKISFAETPLKLSKKLFVETNSDRGPVLTPIATGGTVKAGDKIKVRVELRVDRDMEYVHMKDMRASGFEPVNVLSSYKWQGGLGYYETTKDASTNFFFGYLPKGTYVFEYSLFATVAGNFSNGITSIQCMYAPEFTAHSEGGRVTVIK